MPGMYVGNPPGMDRYDEYARATALPPGNHAPAMSATSYWDWIAAHPATPPPSDTGTPSAAAPSAAPAPGPAAAQPTMPSGGEDIQTPAVQALQGVANPEKLGQQMNPEGWGLEAPPMLSVPGERNLPPSSRALATLAQQRGRVY